MAMDFINIDLFLILLHIFFCKSLTIKFYLYERKLTKFLFSVSHANFSQFSIE